MTKTNKYILVLLVLSVPVIIQTLYEMLILTARDGAQMVLFSVFHGAYGAWGMAVILSYLSVWLNAFSSMMLMGLYFVSPKFKQAIKLKYLVTNSFVLVVFFGIAATYNQWSGSFGHQ